MDVSDYWHRQTAQKPLYPDLIWSRPEQKSTAGKLLIIGGSSGGFSSVAEAYMAAEKARVGQVNVLLPDSLRKIVGVTLSAEFAPATSSGGFAKRSLAEMARLSSWAEATLLAGDLGRNMETAALIEQFVKHYLGPLTIAGDSLDFFMTHPESILDRPETLIGIELKQLQRLARASRSTTAFSAQLEIVRLVEALHEFSARHQSALLLKHGEQAFVAYSGQVSSTPSSSDSLLGLATKATVWWLQNFKQPFEAITSSLVN